MLWLAALPIAALSGCASLTSPDTATPLAPVPTAWFADAHPAAPDQPPTSLALWWQRFHDPQLSALVSQALNANTDVRSAQAALRQARAQRDARVAPLLPNVSGSVAGQRNTTGGNIASDSYSASLDASWEPDIFGANRSALNAAESDVQAASASLASVQVSMAAEVAVTYIEVRSLQARLVIARSNLDSLNETLQITRWRVQAGLTTSLDVEQAVSASEQTQAAIIATETSLTQSISSLSVLTGQPPGALQSSLADAAPVPQADGSLALALPADTLRQRPDVRAAEARIRSALSLLSAADAARYPSFRISGALGLRAMTLGTLTNGASAVSALLGSISVPLFDGGAIQAQVRSQEATLEQARVNYQATVLTALKDVEDALVSLQGNRERLARLQAAANAAANAELLARQRYGSGLIDFRTVLETKRTLLNTQDGVESTRASLSADHVRLYKALGGGWTPDLDAATP
ncbi:MAG: efflux transporter outer membrane subunit [Burkholderiaceae bacterium]|nr:efflux transporter outer membrane subunit [Burkholderiaceae bacterium]